MRPKSRNDFAVAIICALPLEADAVEAVFDETYDRLGKYYSKQEGDANSYINGRIGGHNVVLCYMPGMGKGSAASVASSLRVSYAGVRLALVVGICGGAPSPSANHEIFLGDVVISDSVIEYDFGRKYPGGFQRKTGVKDMLGRPDREIRTLLNGLRAEKTCSELENRILEYLHMIQRAGKQWCHPQLNDVLFKACYLHKHYERASPIRCCCSESELPHNICEDALKDNCDDLGCDKNQVIRCRKALEAVKVSAHIGTVASADTVMKSGQQRDAITREENVIGFEMEGAGVWDNVPCIIVKGVCDYADSHKAKAWQAYAAATGACGAKAFLEYWTPSQKEDTSEKRHLMIPFPKNPRFVGRQHEIHRLEELMSRGSRKLAITGLGGVGKTQVALELAYRMKEKDAECSIFWIPCTSYEAVEQACMTIAQMVGIQDVKPAEVKESIKAYFTQKHGKWLLVFDNADDMDMWTKGSSIVPALKDFLPYNDQGHIIFTSRNRKLAVKLASADVIHVPELDKETGLEFLEKSLIQQSLITNTDTIIALLEQLTFLPLAITQAAAYINENGIGVSDYLLLLQEQEADIVELLSEDFGDDGRYKDVQNPVAMTWLISFSQIQKTDQLAADYLSLMACVNPRNIPQSLFPQPISKKRMVDALGVLNAYSFINIQPGNGFLTLHRLVHLATRNWIRKEQQFSICIIKAADRFNEVFPGDDPTNRQLWREYLPHALFLLGESEFKVQQEQYINFLWKVGRCLDSDGRYNEAEMLFKDVVMLRQQGYGDTHVYTLASIADLASTYWNQGRWKEAEELEIQVMETRKQVQGPEHPDTLTSIANLASTYRNQGQWKKAEKLEMQVIETRKQVLEPEHPKILNSMENLASTYWNQGRWKEAEELDVQVMKIRKQRLGPEHPNTLTSMANLASIYGNQGRWKEAEELEVQVMKIRKQILGPEHPNTLISMANLASTYWNQGRWKEAEELQTAELKLCSKILGPEHPDTLTSIANLALIYGNQGRWKEAEELEVQMMEIRKQILGPEHPNTLTSIANLASTYWNQGRLKEAEELEIQVIKTRKQVLGPEHPSTLNSMANLASTYGNQGRWKEAEELEVQVMETRKQILGPEHPNTLISMANLASTYWNQGRWKEAEELEIQVMETRKQVLGPEHPDTLTSMANLAYTLKSQGKLADALVLMQNCYELRNKVLGPDHPDTRSSSDDLREWED